MKQENKPFAAPFKKDCKQVTPPHTSCVKNKKHSDNFSVPCGNSFFEDVDELPSTLQSYKTNNSPAAASTSGFSFKKPQLPPVKASPFNTSCMTPFSASTSDSVVNNSLACGQPPNIGFQSAQKLTTNNNSNQIGLLNNSAFDDSDFDLNCDLEAEIAREQQMQDSHWNIVEDTQAPTTSSNYNIVDATPKNKTPKKSSPSNVYISQSTPDRSYHQPASSRKCPIIQGIHVKNYIKNSVKTALHLNASSVNILEYQFFLL